MMRVKKVRETGRGSAASGAAIVLAAIVSGAAYPVAAQEGPAGIERRAGEGARPSLQEPQFLDDARPLAPLPPPPPMRAPGAGEAIITIDRIEIAGAKAIPLERLDAVAATYLGRPIATEDILALRDALTAIYINEGYVNSGAVIPQQDISDGVLRIEIVEGRLTDVSANRSKGLRPGYVERRMRIPSSRPLNRDELQRKFQFLINDPNIERIDAQLRPGATPGAATLDLDVTAADRYFANVVFANDRSPSVGGNRLGVQGGIRNILGVGDLLTGGVGASTGIFDANAAFSVPLTSRDLLLTVSGSYADSEVVEEPLNDLDVISLNYSARAGLSYPVLRRLKATEKGARTRVLTLGADLEYIRTETELLGENFSFSPGAVDGVTELKVLRATQSFIQQSAGQVIAFRSTASFGIDAIDPDVMTTITPPEDFVVWLGQVQYARRLNDAGHQLTARLDAQIAANTLFPTEKFAFGGQISVRGYRMNQTLADSGVVGSAEYSLPLGGLVGETALNNVRISAFADAGYGWNSGSAPDPTEDLLVSVGVGVAWTPLDGVSLAASWAARLENPPDVARSGPQDWGLGFRVIVDPFRLF